MELNPEVSSLSTSKWDLRNFCDYLAFYPACSATHLQAQITSLKYS